MHDELGRQLLQVGVPVSAPTAWQALVDVGRVAPGQQVLVTGASGAVGSFAVQLAKVFGAEVTGMCSTAKIDLVRSLGADHVVDYRREDFADGTRRYDLIVDIAGSTPLSRLRHSLTRTGTLVVVGGEGGSWTGGFGRTLRAPLLSPFVRQRLAMLASKERSSDLEELTQLVEAGQLTPAVDVVYSLAQVPERCATSRPGRSTGRSSSRSQPSVTRAAPMGGTPSRFAGPSAAAANSCRLGSVDPRVREREA